MTIFSSRMFIYFTEYLYLNMKLNNQTSCSVNIYFIIPNPLKVKALNPSYYLSIFIKVQLAALITYIIKKDSTQSSRPHSKLPQPSNPCAKHWSFSCGDQKRGDHSTMDAEGDRNIQYTSADTGSRPWWWGQSKKIR